MKPQSLLQMIRGFFVKITLYSLQTHLTSFAKTIIVSGVDLFAVGSGRENKQKEKSFGSFKMVKHGCSVPLSPAHWASLFPAVQSGLEEGRFSYLLLCRTQKSRMHNIRQTNGGLFQKKTTVGSVFSRRASEKEVRLRTRNCDCCDGWSNASISAMGKNRHFSCNFIFCVRTMTRTRLGAQKTYFTNKRKNQSNMGFILRLDEMKGEWLEK